jgi:hypothetical protein
MRTTTSQEYLINFREEVYQILNPARDAAFEIIDAIATSPYARSAVEVSLSRQMERSFSSVYKGLERSEIDMGQLRPMLVSSAEQQGDLVMFGYAIYALDHSPYPRHNAPTVSDRGFVHGANGEEIGRQYSLLGRVMYETGSWVGVVDCERISTSTTPTAVGAQQILRLNQTASVPVIVTADSEYLTEKILDQATDKLRLLIRFKGNRNLFDKPEERVEGKRGAPTKHGAKMKLNRAETLREADIRLEVMEQDGAKAVISVWKELHVETRAEISLCAIRVEMFKADGSRRFQRPFWLAWTGELDLDWATFWRVYLKRFCIEAVHQFTKNSLVWTKARLGSTVREEKWTVLVMLAYWQLLLAAPLARDCRRPWEKPTAEGKLPTPGRVQRDFSRILCQIGSPARSPKVRGIPSGRPVGFRPKPRPRYDVIVKTVKKVEKVEEAA